MPACALAAALLAGCAGSPEPTRTRWSSGTLRPGSSIRVKTTEGPSWSLAVDATDVTLEFEGRQVVLTGLGTREVEFDELAHQGPWFLLRAKGAPLVEWRGSHLQVGDQQIDLTSYAPEPHPVLRLELPAHRPAAGA